MVANILLTLIPLLATCLVVVHAAGDGYPKVTYDKRSLIINGSRELLFSGSIHYPRTQPEVRSFVLAFTRIYWSIQWN